MSEYCQQGWRDLPGSYKHSLESTCSTGTMAHCRLLLTLYWSISTRKRINTGGICNTKSIFTHHGHSHGSNLAHSSVVLTSDNSRNSMFFMKKETDLFLDMLAYRSTPLSCGYSPADWAFDEQTAPSTFPESHDYLFREARIAGSQAIKLSESPTMIKGMAPTITQFWEFSVNRRLWGSKKSDQNLWP